MSVGNKRILVAEADAAARMLLRRRLETESYEVDVVEDGEEALAALAGALPDLLIVDVSLPKVDGLEVVRRLRGVPGGASLPIVVISAYARDLVDRSLDGVPGPEGFFSKPIDFRELQAKVKALMSAPPPAAPALPAEPGRILAFVGAKGGVGTTTIAANVAVALARQGMRALLFEAASFHGTAATLLGFNEQRPPSQLVLDDAENVTLAAIMAALAPHPSGLRALFGATSRSGQPATDAVFALANGLRALATGVVVDLDSAVDAYGQVILRTAQRIWVVTEPEQASVERAGALIQALDQWGIHARVVGLLVNQTNPEMVMEPAEIGQRVGRPVGCWVPYGGSTAFEASRRGQPLIELAGDQPAASALNALAASLVARPAVAAR
jgi:Flp pilus assembly CpaE family ATPase